MNLTGTTHSVELVTSAAGSVDYMTGWTDIDKSGASTVVTPGSDQGNITSATTTTVVAAPGASVSRMVKSLVVRNAHATTAQTITVQKDVSATNYTARQVTLAAGESLVYEDGAGWQVYSASGQAKTYPSEKTGYTGRTVALLKAGTAADTVGYWYCTSKDAGFPGAWAPGTPGIAGRTTDGTTTTDAGCIPFVNASSGGIYLTNANIVSTTAHWHLLFDCLWVNSGITVTTTTAQTVNSVTLPARDLNGTTNGEGCMIGLLTTTANTNAAVVANSTVSYTNSAGTAGRTATLLGVAGAQIPATPVIGTLTWFLLAAGDSGVRSIQSITLATSLGAGAVSLLIARPVLSVPAAAASVGGYAVLQDQNPGIRLYNGTCLLHCYNASATTATTTSGTLTMMER